MHVADEASANVPKYLLLVTHAVPKVTSAAMVARGSAGQLAVEAPLQRHVCVGAASIASPNKSQQHMRTAPVDGPPRRSRIF